MPLAPLERIAMTMVPDLFESRYRPLRLAGASPKTITTYRAAVNAWVRCMGRVAVPTIDSALLATFQERLLKQVGVASANTYCAHLMVLLRFAADEDVGLLKRLPKWRRLKEPKRSPLALTVEEFQQVLEAARTWHGEIAGYPAGDWWSALLLVGWETGLRYSALLTLRSVDVLWDSRGLFCQADTQKDKEGLWFALPEHVLAALRRIHDPGRELLFPRNVSIDCVGRWFRTILDRSGIYAPKGCGQRFHRLRRSKASYTRVLGGNATVALGHCCEAVTLRYFDPRIVGVAKQPAMPSPLLYASEQPRLRVYG